MSALHMQSTALIKPSPLKFYMVKNLQYDSLHLIIINSSSTVVTSVFG